MTIKERLKKFWKFLNGDSWQSWIVSLILILIFIKLILFPGLSLLTGSPLPLVVVESCSMYHESDFEGWWDKNSGWYESKNITKEQFQNFPFKFGLNKGDIILVMNKGDYNLGDIIIFNANSKYPLIHRIVTQEPLGTKGDHNMDQIVSLEKEITEDNILGKSYLKIPLLGWIKLIFYEFKKPQSERGFCR
jgi:signal peptidase I